MFTEILSKKVELSIDIRKITQELRCCLPQQHIVMSDVSCQPTFPLRKIPSRTYATGYICLNNDRKYFELYLQEIKPEVGVSPKCWRKIPQKESWFYRISPHSGFPRHGPSIKCHIPLVQCLATLNRFISDKTENIPRLVAAGIRLHLTCPCSKVLDGIFFLNRNNTQLELGNSDVNFLQCF